jgi:hypothetical protein
MEHTTPPPGGNFSEQVCAQRRHERASAEPAHHCALNCAFVKVKIFSPQFLLTLTAYLASYHPNAQTLCD